MSEHVVRGLNPEVSLERGERWWKCKGETIEAMKSFFRGFSDGQIFENENLNL